MDNILNKLQKFYSGDKFLISPAQENPMSKFFKKELDVSTEEANIFGIILYFYINEGCAVSIKEICEDYSVSKKTYLKIIEIVHNLEKKGLILTDEKRSRSNRMINPDIEVDDIIFRKIIYGEEILSQCDFKNFYSIVETVDNLIELLEDDEKISLKFFKEKMKEIIRKTDQGIPLGKILSRYSLDENLLFLYTLTKNFNSWGEASISLNSFSELMEMKLNKKMKLLDNVITGKLKIFKDKKMEIILDKTEPILSSSVDVDVKISGETMAYLLNRKIKNFKLNSDLIIYKQASDFKLRLFFNSKLNKEMDKIKRFLSKSQFKKIKKELAANNLSSGAVILFYGSPGTGKTASVYDISEATGRDILQVNFSQVQSMWVGESEKNMKKIFDEYRIALGNTKLEPILLFNEADSLIAKRVNVTNSVDQMSNSLQNILLEELENFSGIFIATTNLIENIDPAFDRRFIYKLEFTKPDEANRKKIWQNKLPELKDSELDMLALYDVTGGQIDNVVKRYLINKILELKKTDMSEIIEYIKDELNFRGKNYNRVGF